MERSSGLQKNGVIDPLNGYPEIRAVLWKDGRIIDLGTLPGGNESFAGGVNNRGQIAGFSFDASNLIRAVRWTEDQGIQDLGTLGACCAIAGTINERGQISGESGLCDTCNQDAFLWEHGHMYHIAGFGGPITGHADVNNRGQVVGQSESTGRCKCSRIPLGQKEWDDGPGYPGRCRSTARWINELFVYQHIEVPFALAKISDSLSPLEVHLAPVGYGAKPQALGRLVREPDLISSDCPQTDFEDLGSVTLIETAFPPSRLLNRHCESVSGHNLGLASDTPRIHCAWHTFRFRNAFRNRIVVAIVIARNA
jgi:probable HAF family extracellular repeat protein